MTTHRTFTILLAALLLGGTAFATRIKDVTHLEGARDNQLIGYGLIVGLDGSGDGSSTEFTVRSLVSYLRRQGMTIDPDLVKTDNVAAVIVTADLPPFARGGQRIDINVASIGDADSLQGGTLLMTELKGADGQVYAVAQGSISLGGFDAGSGGSSVQKNHTTAGKIPGGALIEREPPTKLEGRTTLRLLIDNPDFTTARRVAEVIKENFPDSEATATDNASVSLKIPQPQQSQVAAFIASLEGLPVHPDSRARIVIDERTGTVVMGEDVRISTLAIAHGNLSIQIAQNNQVSQPGPFSEGTTTPVTNTQVNVEEQGDKLTVVDEGVSLGEVVRSLNAIGVTPRDLIAILQSIKSAGALQSEIVIR